MSGLYFARLSFGLRFSFMCRNVSFSDLLQRFVVVFVLTQIHLS